MLLIKDEIFFKLVLVFCLIMLLFIIILKLKIKFLFMNVVSLIFLLYLFFNFLIILIFVWLFILKVEINLVFNILSLFLIRWMYIDKIWSKRDELFFEIKSFKKLVKVFKFLFFCINLLVILCFFFKFILELLKNENIFLLFDKSL